MAESLMLEKLNIEFLSKETDGIRYIISDVRDIIQSFWAGGMNYEPEMIEFIKANYKGGTFVDAGSCLGSHTYPFSKIADTVYSFEPYILTFLHQKLINDINKITNVKHFNVGLSNKRGVARLFRDERSSGGGAVREDGQHEIVLVKLDDFDLKDVKLIKIDVEGHELQVLEGGRETIYKNLPDLYVECTYDKSLENVLNFLKNIDDRYTYLDKPFNASPTYLFTIKDLKSFKEGEKIEKNINNRG